MSRTDGAVGVRFVLCSRSARASRKNVRTYAWVTSAPGPRAPRYSQESTASVVATRVRQRLQTYSAREAEDGEGVGRGVLRSGMLRLAWP